MIIKTDFLESYLKDESNYLGKANSVYIPENEDELQEIISHCFNSDLHFTMRGAGTGLTAGSTPDKDVLISLEKLNKIKKIDTENERITIEPCVTLEQLDTYLKEYEYFYPPNPTESKSSLGGNVATNASGSRSFKYGPTRNFVTKLKVILPNGEVLKLERGKNIAKNGKLTFNTENNTQISIDVKNIFNTNVKNASGYYLTENMDAIDLFIGSEGTLGVFSEIELKILKRPQHIIGLIVWFNNFDKLYDFFSIINSKINKYSEVQPRIIEFYNTTSLNFLRATFPQIPETANYAIWIEEEYNKENEDKLLENYFNTIFEFSNIPDETWTAMSEEEHKKFATFRHSLPEKTTELVRQLGHTKLSIDVAVPMPLLKEYYLKVEEVFKDLEMPSCIYGHISSAHLHCDMFYSNAQEKVLADKIYSKVISIGLDLGGVVSAEHGIGKIKRQFFYQMYDEETINYMKSIKSTFDTKNLLGNNNLFY